MPMSPRLLRPRASGSNIGLQEAADWQARVVANGGTVSAATLAAVQQFCLAIHAAGIRDRFYRLNLFCGDQLAAALVPLYRAESLASAARGNSTDVNNGFVSTDYALTSGINRPSGTVMGNKFLNTGLNADVLTQSNRHMFCQYDSSVVVGEHCVMGMDNFGAGSNLFWGMYPNSTTSARYRCSTSTSFSAGNTTTPGVTRFVVSGNGTATGYMNGQPRRHYH